MTLNARSICAAHGYDHARIQATLSAFNINKKDEELARCIRRDLIDGRAEEIVESALVTLSLLPECSNAESQRAASGLKQDWIDQLRSFGHSITKHSYFAHHLQISSVNASAGVPLVVLQMQHHLTTIALSESLHSRFSEDPSTIVRLLPCILKISSLGLHLSIAGYHQKEIELHKNLIEQLRDEAARLHQKADRDQLTGLLSFSRLMEVLDIQIQKSSQTGAPLCVMMADLDFFKKVNDTFGHLVGDIVLRHTGERIKSAVRDFDVVGRFGGEEFIILTQSDPGLAKDIAERVRADISSTPFNVKGNEIDVTISIGLTMLKPHDSREALLERADAAMYEAKRTGRNRVVVAEDIEAACASLQPHPVVN